MELCIPSGVYAILICIGIMCSTSENVKITLDIKSLTWLYMLHIKFLGLYKAACDNCDH